MSKISASNRSGKILGTLIIFTGIHDAKLFTVKLFQKQ